MMIEMKEGDFIVSKTDLKGRLTYVNKIFMEIAGYKEEELLGKPHNIIRHPDMPKAVFKLLWNMIQNGEEIFAYVLNRTKNNDDYWVYANVTPSYDVNGKIIGYYSVRRKPGAGSLETIEALYAQMLSAEKKGGVNAGMELLNNILHEKGVSYNELIIDIQG